MSEFSLIAKYCQKIGTEHQNTKVSVGDDAAVVSVQGNQDTVMSVDTMVSGVHFFEDELPENIARKILAVNLSDMAAMGATARWALLALTMPSENTAWLGDFSSALHKISEEHQVQLVGGDTTKGALTLSLTIIGTVAKNQALLRSGAQIDDTVYVSNTLGEAALALHRIQHKKSVAPTLRKALSEPIPQCALGKSLCGIASSCIDISDGLVADLSHIAQKSEVSMTLDIEKIPVSDTFLQFASNKERFTLPLYGGEDYQLAFTASAQQQSAIAKLQQTYPIKAIGKVIAQSKQAIYLRYNNAQYPLAEKYGYQHF